MLLQFKEWLDGSISLALVGASRNPDNPEHRAHSENDASMLDSIVDYFYKKHPDIELGRNVVMDYIDLNDGRDFLKENKKYNLVALMRVYHPHIGGQHSVRVSQQQTGDSMFKLSSDHTPEKWKNRLKSTNAEIIFVFGGWECVDADYLGSIPGYNGPQTHKHDLSVYTKNGN